MLEIDAFTKPLILAVLPYASEFQHTHEILEGIARFSRLQPLDAYEVWRELLKFSQPDYPETAVRTALGCMIQSGESGVRNAKAIASEYLRKGNEGPRRILKEVMLNGG